MLDRVSIDAPKGRLRASQVPPGVYFGDVELQLACLDYAEEFNKFKPPKPVKIIFCHILELLPESFCPALDLDAQGTSSKGKGTSRPVIGPGSKVFAVERFIEGK